jgi:hypothetical protein
MDNYCPGKGCQCSAHYEGECACDGVDWTPKRVRELEQQLAKLREAVMKVHKANGRYHTELAWTELFNLVLNSHPKTPQ